VSYLLDSDWLIDALIGKSAAVTLVARLRHEGLAVSVVSYGEVFEGAVRAANPQAELNRFRAFLRGFALVPLSDPIMERFAFTRADLRGAGRLIPDLDLLIAASAIHHDLTLVTRNRRHFARVPGLRLYEGHTLPS
jgi:predicted nucleic acid-binding protein